VVLISTLVLINIGVFGYLQMRTSSAQAAVEASALASPGTPSSTASAPSSTESSAETAPATVAPPATSPVLAVYGDGYSAGSSFGGQGAAGWPALVAQGLGMELRLTAVAQTGYVSPGVTGQTLGDLITSSPPADADVTVVFGSRNDLAESAGEVGAASTAALAVIRAAAPETSVVVIGPMWTGGGAPGSLLAVRDAVQASAAAAGVAFIDPLAENWFGEAGPAIATDGISATDFGHRDLAQLITVPVQAALTR
jgi:hypothetical protein